MKKCYLSVLLIVGFSMHLFSQPILENARHSLKPGDKHHFIITKKAKEGPAGYNKVWDFSDLTKKGEMKSQMISAGFVKNSGKIPEANVVLEERGTHFFFSVSEEGMKQYGTITKNNTVIQYDEPFLKMAYPFEYGDTKTGTFSGKMITSKDEKAFSGNYKIQVDGFGKLKLPGDVVVEDVVRLKSTKTRKYEGSSNKSTIISYKWYCNQVRYPLLTVIKSKRSGKSHYMKTAYYADAADIEQNKEDQNKAKPTELSKSNVRVFPNPFKDRFTVEYQLPSAQDVEISVYSTSGQKVKQIKLNDQAAGNYRRDISASGNEFAEGLYHVNIKTSDKVIKKTLMKLK
jgi:hypothetical protein